MFSPEPTSGRTALEGMKLRLFLSEETPAFLAAAGSAAVGSLGVGAAAAALGGGAAGAGGPVSAGAGGLDLLHIFVFLFVFLGSYGLSQERYNLLVAYLPVVIS